jgi:hypothetical protein
MRQADDNLARGRFEREKGGMELTGTTLARSPRMNDRPLSPLPSILAKPGAQDAPAPAPAVGEDDGRRGDTRDAGLDKYDISTLACTD